MHVEDDRDGAEVWREECSEVCHGSQGGDENRIPSVIEESRCPSLLEEFC
jgi:hypothetical protein